MVRESQRAFYHWSAGLRRVAFLAVVILLVPALTANGQGTATDSSFIAVGNFPRFESDPYIRRPTVSVEPTFTDKETEQQWQIAFKYGMPFINDRWSWQLSVPIEEINGPGKQASGLSDIELTLNHEISRGAWKQAASMQLTAKTATNDQLGGGQWQIMPTYAIGHWLSSLFSTGMLLSWQYGFLVDSGKTQTDIVEPRILFSTHLDVAGDMLSLDLRPRFDLTRQEFYSTLMPFLSGSLGRHFSGQFGFEFPLSQLAAKRVENSRVYVDISHGW